MTGDAFDAESTLLRTGIRPAPAAAQFGHYLAFRDGPALRRVEIGAAGVTIGRVAPCEVVINLPDISRRHCRVEIDGERAVLVDLGSTNGTFLGGERLAGPAALHNGCRLSLGGVPLRYEQRDRREVAAEAELEGELRRAAEYVRAILPAPIAAGPVLADWCFVPSSQLGGDAFGYGFQGPDVFTGFILDVSGHGIGAAMHAANAANALRRRSLPGVDFADPAQVAAGLNAIFTMEDHAGLLLTLWCFAYHVPSRSLRYVSAGHHPALLVAPDVPAPLPLRARGATIGMIAGARWTEGAATLPPGSTLYLSSDGAFETAATEGRQWDIEDLMRLVADAPGPAAVYQAVREAAPDGPLSDDFAVLALRFP